MSDNPPRRGRPPHLHTIGDRTLTFAAWADEYGINKKTLFDRMLHGRTLEEALKMPSRGVGQRRRRQPESSVKHPCSK